MKKDIFTEFMYWSGMFVWAIIVLIFLGFIASGIYNALTFNPNTDICLKTELVLQEPTVADLYQHYRSSSNLDNSHIFKSDNNSVSEYKCLVWVNG